MPNRTPIDVLPIQEAVAVASPSAWLDGLVASSDLATVSVVLLDGEVRVLTSQASPQPGEPVAVHPVAEILAVGGAWYAARPTVGEQEPVA